MKKEIERIKYDMKPYEKKKIKDFLSKLAPSSLRNVNRIVIKNVDKYPPADISIFEKIVNWFNSVEETERGNYASCCKVITLYKSKTISKKIRWNHVLAVLTHEIAHARYREGGYKHDYNSTEEEIRADRYMEKTFKKLGMEVPKDYY